MAGSRGRRLATAFSFAALLAVCGPALANAPRPQAPTPEPTAVAPIESVGHRFLMRVERNDRLECHAVVDAWSQTQGPRLLGWRMNVTYYPPNSPKGKPGQLSSRVYGGSVGSQVGGRNIQLELKPDSILFDLPTPGGDQLITCSGQRDATGFWRLLGSASFGPKKHVENWTVRSVARFQHGKQTILAVP